MAIAVLALGAACAPMRPPADRLLIWADEFDGATLDERCWNRVVESPPWDPQQYVGYVDSPRNLYLSDGLLWIDAYREAVVIDGRASHFTSAQITTQDRAYWSFGYFEVRMRVPAQHGAFPAFWMMPQWEEFGHWPYSGEIDIMEHLGREPNVLHTTIHYADWEGRHIARGRATRVRGAPLSDDFHVYGLEWRDGVMRWYLDDRLVHQARRWWGPPREGRRHTPFDSPFYLLLNLAVGGQWAEEPRDDTEFPMRMAVDYVRVYRLPGTERPQDAGAPETPCPAGGPAGVP